MLILEKCFFFLRSSMIDLTKTFIFWRSGVQEKNFFRIFYHKAIFCIFGAGYFIKCAIHYFMFMQYAFYKDSLFYIFLHNYKNVRVFEKFSFICNRSFVRFVLNWSVKSQKVRKSWRVFIIGRGNEVLFVGWQFETPESQINGHVLIHVALQTAKAALKL